MAARDVVGPYWPDGQHRAFEETKKSKSPAQ